VHEWITALGDNAFGTASEVGICTEGMSLGNDDEYKALFTSEESSGMAWALRGGDSFGLFSKGKQLFEGSESMNAFGEPVFGRSSAVLGTGLEGGHYFMWRLDCDRKNIHLFRCPSETSTQRQLVAKWSIASAWDGTARLFPCAASTKAGFQVELLPAAPQKVFEHSEFMAALAKAQDAAVESERQLLRDIAGGVAEVQLDQPYCAPVVTVGASAAFLEQSAHAHERAAVALARVDISTLTTVKDIGQGGFGVVRLVQCSEFPGMQFACKQLSSGVDFEQTAELQAINAIQHQTQHPNIVWVQSLVENEGRCCGLLMSYAAGGSLTKTIYPHGHSKAAPVTEAGQPGPFQDLPSLKKRLQWCVQIASALAHLHKLRVWHRDLKPDNILLTSSNWQEADAKLSDFGQSKLTRDGGTQNTQTVTTVLYFPPEGFSNKWNSQSDVYQLGLTLYQVLTGLPLWSKLDSRTHLQAQLMRLLCIDTDCVLHDSVGPWPDVLPPVATRVLQECLSRRYEDRPTALDVAIRLNSVVSAIAAESSVES
jgi:hypothetical protein